MTSNDIIRRQLSLQMDWGKFEELVFEILLQDDLPSLRKIGGSADFGVDAIETSYYTAESQVHRIVQVTSQGAQKAKFSDTVKKLRENGIDFGQLVMVYRHPVSASIQNLIQAKGTELGVVVDIRDESYLVGQLGKPDCGIFARFFLDDEAQLKSLLAKGNPISDSDRIRHAMLASLGAFLLNPEARLVRHTFFDRTVLAVVIASEEAITTASALDGVADLLPTEVVDVARLHPALKRLEKVGLIKLTGSSIAATDLAFSSLAKPLKAIHDSFNELLTHVVSSVKGICKIDDSLEGRIERNIKRTLLVILRLLGPIDELDSKQVTNDIKAERCVSDAVARDLPQDVARATLTALNEYVKSEESRPYLAVLARSYAAIALRNMDPVGRNWQKQEFARSSVFLDTDVVLKLIVKELPSHELILRSLRAVKEAGVSIKVTQFVLDEAVTHLSRADRTHFYVKGKLQFMSIEQAADIPHAVVRGYYYQLTAKTVPQPFDDYWHNYYDRQNSEGYVQHLLGKRIQYSVVDEMSLDGFSLADMEAISTEVIKHREFKRAKAAFRKVADMEERARLDVRLALFAAQSRTKAYVISSDGSFQMMASHSAWGRRPKVHIHTEALPGLAELVGNVRFQDDGIVRLLFNPIHIAAAEMIKEDLDPLLKVGVSLMNKDLGRLEWDIKNGLATPLFEYKKACAEAGAASDRRIRAAIELARQASGLGYEIQPELKPVIKEFETLVQRVSDEQKRRVEAEDLVQRLVVGATGLTKKGRRRLNSILRESNLLNRGDSTTSTGVDDGTIIPNEEAE